MKKILIVGALLSAIAFSAFAGQSPNQVYPAVNTSGYAAPQTLDADGNVMVNDGATKSVLNVTTSTVVGTVAAGVDRIVSFVVTTAGAAGAIYDSNSTSGNTAANLIAVMPATVGIYQLNWPVASGVLVVPGASQVVSTSLQ
jgi:hypothetical protein